MKTFTWIIVCAWCLSTMTAEAKMSPYGFGAVSVDNTDGNYTLVRERVGVKITMPDTTLSECFEYNFVTKSVVYAHVRKDFYFGKTGLSIIGGTHLAPPQYLWDGAKVVQTPRWSVMHDQCNTFSTGLYAEYRYNGLVVRVSHASHSSATVSFNGFSVVWEDRAGYGIVFDKSLNSMVHPSAGYMRLTDGTETYYAQNYAQITKSVRGYVLVDLGDFRKGSLVGLTYSYAPNSFLKLYYDSRRTDDWVMEVTFSF